MAARSKARTVFDRSNTGIVGLNSARGMGACPRFLCCAVLCAGSGLATGRSPVQGVLLNVQKQSHKFQKSNSESEQARGPNPNSLLLKCKEFKFVYA
jgi:hypothetical protein